jgi:hypothetical protein
MTDNFPTIHFNTIEELLQKMPANVQITAKTANPQKKINQQYEFLNNLLDTCFMGIQPEQITFDDQNFFYSPQTEEDGKIISILTDTKNNKQLILTDHTPGQKENIRRSVVVSSVVV